VTPFTVLATAAGAGLIGLVGRDAFDALFHAEGRGTFSRQITRGVWHVLRGAGARPGLLPLAGPIVRFRSRLLLQAIDDLARTATRFRGSGPTTPEQLLREYARDHRVDER
jgi:hypothetical protein